VIDLNVGEAVAVGVANGDHGGDRMGYAEPVRSRGASERASS
jgi:hypothetical protein